MTYLEIILSVALAASIAFSIWLAFRSADTLADRDDDISDLHRDIHAKQKRFDDIAALQTPNANATVQKMGAIARNEPYQHKETMKRRGL